MFNLTGIKDRLNKGERFWIAFTGDSKTSCEWVHPNWREIVEYALKEELEREYGNDWKIPSWHIRTFNFGYDGATTKDVLNHVNDVGLVKPDLVIGIMGSNDMKMGISTDEHVSNIRKIIESLNTNIVWCSSILSLDEDRNRVYKTYTDSLMKISQNKDLLLINLLDSFKNFPLDEFFTFKENNAPDLTHPNQLGNAYIAKVILKEVFDIEFDPEKFWRETIAGKKYPLY